MHYETHFKCVVVGASAGGMVALGKLFSMLPRTFPLSIIAVQHLHPSEGGYLPVFLARKCALPVKEVEDKMPVLKGHVYIAPANYHLLVEMDESFSLSIDARVNYSRPSIDVLFESAARVWGADLIGIILTGANQDGTNGLRKIKECGGMTMAQDPETAETPFMPSAAIDAGVVDRVMTLEKIGAFLSTIDAEASNLRCSKW